jgi:hypothetical protein
MKSQLNYLMITLMYEHLNKLNNLIVNSFDCHLLMYE